MILKKITEIELIIFFRHNKEIQDLCSAHSSRITQLQKQIQQLQEENHALKAQHQGIITAVSSILTPRDPVMVVYHFSVE